MIIKDEQLLGDYTMRILIGDKIDVFEGDGKHAKQCNNITDAMHYIMNRRIAEMDKVVNLKEYFEFITSYSKELESTFPPRKLSNVAA